MKHTYEALFLTAIAVGALHASNVISCSGSQTAINNCSSSHLSDFNETLYWNSMMATDLSAPAALNGDSYDTTWDGVGAGVDFTVSGDDLRLAQNYAVLPNGSGGWLNASNIVNHPFLYFGNFDTGMAGGHTSTWTPGAPCNGTAPTCYGGYTPGDSLIGNFDGSAIVIGFNSSLSNLGFRVSSFTNSTFELVLNLYASDNGTGTPIQTITENYASGGGTCGALFGAPGSVCNTSPFIEVEGLSASVQSFSVNTNDSTGFYIDSLFYDSSNGASVPEPSSMLLAGAGMAGLIALARRRQRA